MIDIVIPNFKPHAFSTNAVVLRNFFALRAASDVPIETFTIISDGVETRNEVRPGNYKCALFILFLYVLSGGKSEFNLTREAARLVLLYYGPKLALEALQPGNKPSVIRALLGTEVTIRVTVKPSSVQAARLDSIMSFLRSHPIISRPVS